MKTVKTTIFIILSVILSSIVFFGIMSLLVDLKLTLSIFLEALTLILIGLLLYDYD